MTQNIMNKPIVLQLNGNWQPIGQKSVKDAIISMTSIGDQPAAQSIDISYAKDENGEYDFSHPEYMNLVGWDEWAQLPIREYDFVIHSARLTMRAPTVIVAPNYRKMPMKKPAATKYNVFERDGGVCQYTGKKISRTAGNIDHILPQSKGGKNTFTNMVWCDQKVNFKKGNKSNSEAGLKLIRKPFAPKEAAISTFIREAKHPTWIHFLTHIQN